MFEYARVARELVVPRDIREPHRSEDARHREVADPYHASSGFGLILRHILGSVRDMLPCLESISPSGLYAGSP
jgi:hypothetical protein